MTNEQRLAEALTQLLIAIGMGWDLQGVIEQAQVALRETGHAID